MTKSDMKPCPFCGGDKNTICKTDYEGGDSYAVSCRFSNCHGAIFMLGYGYFPAKDQAIAAWNTRAIDPAAIREDALREAAAVAEAKLAKAVDALQYYAFEDVYGIGPARSLLADLEKEE